MGAGKSSLVLRFVKGQFFDYQVFPLSSPPSLPPSLPPSMSLHLFWSRYGFWHWNSILWCGKHLCCSIFKPALLVSILILLRNIGSEFNASPNACKLWSFGTSEFLATCVGRLWCAFGDVVQESTIGAAFLTQTLAVNDVTVKFEIWDTAGQERYHSLAPMYYRGAAAAVIVYDITNAVCTLLVSSTECMFIIFNEKSRVPFCVRHSLYPFSSLLRKAPSGTRSCCILKGANLKFTSGVVWECWNFKN